MPGEPTALELGRAWLANGEEDLDSCEGLIQARPERTVAIAFHAQQCVEKCLKAILFSQGSVPPRTHNIGVLVSMLSPSIRDRALRIPGINGVTVFAVEQRYAVFAERPSFSDVLDAHRIALDVHQLATLVLCDTEKDQIG